MLGHGIAKKGGLLCSCCAPAVLLLCSCCAPAAVAVHELHLARASWALATRP